MLNVVHQHSHSIPCRHTISGKQNRFVYSTDKLADRTHTWILERFAPKDYEKRINFMGKAATLVNRGSTLAIGSLQASITIDTFAKKGLIFTEHANSVYKTALTAIRVPLTGLSLGMSLIQWGVEFLNLMYTSIFLDRLHGEKDPLKQLDLLDKKYFQLTDVQTNKINAYVEGKFPSLNGEEKEARVEQVKEKALGLRFTALKRRVTPALADIVKEVLDNPVEDTLIAEIRAKTLIESLDRAAHTKILVHILGIAALSLSIISGVVFLGGVTILPFFIAIGAVSVALSVSQYIVKKRALNKESGVYYRNVLERTWRAQEPLNNSAVSSSLSFGT